MGALVVMLPPLQRYGLASDTGRIGGVPWPIRRLLIDCPARPQGRLEVALPLLRARHVFKLLDVRAPRPARLVRSTAAGGSATLQAGEEGRATKTTDSLYRSYPSL